MKASPLKDKSYLLAKLVIGMYKYLTIEKKEFVLSKQLLRSGTNPGAMVRESRSAESLADFIHKLKIAQKETSETMYWLELLRDTKYIELEYFDEVNGIAQEVMKLLVSSIMTSKAKLK